LHGFQTGSKQGIPVDSVEPVRESATTCMGGDLPPGILNNPGDAVTDVDRS